MAGFCRSGSRSLHHIARGGVDGARGGEIFGAPGAELGEFAGAGEEHAFEGTDGGIIAFNGGFEAAADLVEVVGKSGYTVVEGATESTDLVGIFRDGFLSPAVGRRLQECNERGGRGEQDAARECAVEQQVVGLQRRSQEMIAGKKQDDELGRGLELLPVIFRAERVDMAADFLGVLDQPGGAHGFIRRVARGAKRLERGFRINDDSLAAGQANDEVGPQAVGGFLFAKIAVRKHVRHLDDAAQLQLAPASCVGRGPERGRQPSGFGLKLELREIEGLELLAERSVGTGARFFDLAHLGIHFLKGFADRPDEGFDGLLPLFEVACGLLLELRKRLFRLFEEVTAIGAQCVGGEGLELVGEPLMGRTLGVELGREACVDRGEARCFVAHGCEIGGESAILLFARPKPLGERVFPRPKEEPDERRRQARSEEGDSD